LLEIIVKSIHSIRCDPRKEEFYQDGLSSDSCGRRTGKDQIILVRSPLPSALPSSNGLTERPPQRLNKSRSQRILWLLEELKVPYEIETFKRTSQGLAPKSLKAIHPLGKSPVISVIPPGTDQRIILAESGFIVEYLTEYYGDWLNPKKFPEGKEGHIGQEREQWRRNRNFMHYAEGSLMVLLVLKLIMDSKYTHLMRQSSDMVFQTFGVALSPSSSNLSLE
jgi:hypothetical protein